MIHFLNKLVVFDVYSSGNIAVEKYAESIKSVSKEVKQRTSHVNTFKSGLLRMRRQVTYNTYRKLIIIFKMFPLNSVKDEFLKCEKT